MSEKITRPDGPSRSSAPNAMRPSPVPTSSSVSPGRSRARSSTVSRTGYRNSVRSFSRRAASPPNRTSSSHRCQRSVPSVMPGYSARLAVPEVTGWAPSQPLPVPTQMRDELVQYGSERAELAEMCRGEAAQAGLAVGGEPDSRDAAVLGVGVALHQPGRRRPAGELDGAVVAQQQVASKI